jgi:hypothetical protein
LRRVRGRRRSTWRVARYTITHLVVIVIVVFLDRDDAPTSPFGDGNDNGDVIAGGVDRRIVPLDDDASIGGWGTMVIIVPARLLRVVVVVVGLVHRHHPVALILAILVFAFLDGTNVKRVLYIRHAFLELDEHFRIGARACGGVAALVEYNLPGLGERWGEGV